MHERMKQMSYSMGSVFTVCSHSLQSSNIKGVEGARGKMTIFLSRLIRSVRWFRHHVLHKFR